jgi:threonine/homoserine efflux transporter RhtA
LRGRLRSAAVTSAGNHVMNINMSIGPLIALVAGILILIVPRLLNYIVAIYLIIIGLLGLFGPLRL